MRAILLLFFCLSSIVYAKPPFARRFYNKEAGHPVVLVPGDGGSQLEAKLNGKPYVPHYTCWKTTSDYFDLWLNLELFVYPAIDCWADNMMLVFDNETGLSNNTMGVDIRVPGFGATESVEWLDKSKASQGRYFYDIVEAMVSWGYSRGKDVIGAPFDWRKSPNELHDYYAMLKTRIEMMHRYNNNKKVVIVGHSMGNPVMLYFYNNYVNQDWKDKFIQSHVSLAAPWAGAMQIVRLFVSGYNMNYYRVVLPPYKLRSMQRSFSSSAFLFPNPAAWGKDDILAWTDNKNYTVENIEELFTDIKYETGWEQYKAAGRLLGNIDAPGVPVHCAYGVGVDTPQQFYWQSWWFPDYPPKEINGDGDGTVNVRSASFCANWKDKNNGNPVTVHEIEKADHMAILQAPAAIELIRQAIYDEI